MNAKLSKIIEAVVDKKIHEHRFKMVEATEDEYIETFNQIDWENVAAEILKAFKIKTTLKFRRKGKYVEMISDDIIKQCGIFQYALGTCHLTFLESLLPAQENIFWGTIGLTYPGNGLSIGTIWVAPDGKITLRKAQPRSNT